ncbi:NADH dehydrogenase [ubiquinone] 1 alpha subcomplex assembly factor 2 [Contarinia nasturtii]|uniref:NADH dehydrogenase [ubiquinone] 1 alpha subcomplex assembly factor 2 n=1 Tax=Contarinia nasturtii TaxID=265458 RepID=UPI0012D3B74C|nr:NADH dehydrogenase [ubiquinone] 1 alpha subcomplex assembly factor 2 [Contarinia nasturtii]
MSKNRTMFTALFQNFWKSLKPRQQIGSLMGEDYFGNKYYEIPARPEIGKRRPERWFVPADKSDESFDNELTAEWESWLRLRRVDPPTDEELKHNLAIMQMKKINAAELDNKYLGGEEKPPQITTGLSDFPRYDEYETVVGKKPPKKEDS